MLAELDTQASYEGVDPDAQPADFPEDSKIGKMVGMLIERQKEIEAQRRALEQAYSSSTSELREDLDALQGVQNLGKEMHELFGRPDDQRGERKAGDDAFDFNEKMKELRIERQRVKAEIEVAKEQKDRSAGELALMFMGINQVAFDLLVENPMTGYMNEIIFSRVLGHEDIEQGTYWVDTVQCWVCQKWNKQTFTFNPEDGEVFQQKIGKLEHLHHTIHQKVQDGLNQQKAELIDDDIETVMID